MAVDGPRSALTGAPSNPTRRLTASAMVPVMAGAALLPAAGAASAAATGVGVGHSPVPTSSSPFASILTPVHGVPTPGTPCAVVQTQLGYTLRFALNEEWARRFAQDPAARTFSAQEQLELAAQAIAFLTHGDNVISVQVGGLETAPDNSRDGHDRRTAGLNVRSPKDQDPLGAARADAALPQVLSEFRAHGVDSPERVGKLAPYEYNLTPTEMRRVKGLARKYKSDVITMVERYHRERGWMEKHQPDAVRYFDDHFGIKGVQVVVKVLADVPVLVCVPKGGDQPTPVPLVPPPYTTVPRTPSSLSLVAPRTGPAALKLDTQGPPNQPRETSGPINTQSGARQMKEPNSGNYSSNGDGFQSQGPRANGKKHHYDGKRSGRKGITTPSRG